MKVSIKEINQMRTGIIQFADTIYNNFIHLSSKPQLQHNRQELRRLLSSHNTTSYVAYMDKTIIGYLVGETKKLNDGRFVFYISYLYVGQKYRGLKLGSKLMDLVLKKCKKEGIQFVTLTCDIDDKKVIEFYERMGFMPDPILRNHSKHEVFTLYL
jgi:ribosomal protein S18 acetylase RimI-like enzyme